MIVSGFMSTSVVVRVQIVVFITFILFYAVKKT